MPAFSSSLREATAWPTHPLFQQWPSSGCETSSSLCMSETWLVTTSDMTQWLGRTAAIPLRGWPGREFMPWRQSRDIEEGEKAPRKGPSLCAVKPVFCSCSLLEDAPKASCSGGSESMNQQESGPSTLSYCHCTWSLEVHPQAPRLHAFTTRLAAPAKEQLTQ